MAMIFGGDAIPKILAELEGREWDDLLESERDVLREVVRQAFSDEPMTIRVERCAACGRLDAPYRFMDVSYCNEHAP